MTPPIEVRWLWRRIYTYAATLMNSAGVGAIVWKLDDPGALKWLGLALIAANVVMATLYLAGATVTDWAKLAAAARGPRD
ncbi:hypothetical protein [Phenylobacterium sp. SCN 70-31]|uniref:hypothetical protein n=1 Tax=unclassified Phenylobacterium TaxID=2640670 RepID=UPI000868FB36|nr:hypothetical protein [Phenylobacterium sp. SCN 70-31]ODT85575.1 MAG: hypothetical protein ABS78_19645 [Phenylobacterium sp. SCN 70-31]